MNYKFAVAFVRELLAQAEESGTSVEVSAVELEFLIDVFDSLIEL